MATILVVDDELGIRALLSEILSDEGHTVEVAEDAAEARTLRERAKPDLVLLDIWMPDVDGITLLKEWGSSGQLTMPVIMMSGHGTIDTAVEAMKFGASAFLEKPVTLQKLLRAVEEGLSRPVDARVGASGLSSASGGAAGQRMQGAAMAGTSPGQGVQAGPDGIAAMGHGAGSGASIGMPMGHGAGLANGSLSQGGAQQPAMLQAGAGGQMPMAAAHAVAGADAMASAAPHSHQSFDLDRPLREARDAFEKSYFEYHLAKENGSMTRVAEKTGLERTHLYRKLKHLGVDLSRAKRQSH